MVSSLPDYADSEAPLQIRRFTRKEYHALIDAGVLDEDEQCELLDGVIVPMTPQGGRHSKAIIRLNMLLAPALSGRAMVGVQVPFAASDISEPEPDLFIVHLDEDDFDDENLREAYCIIEVAVTSQRRDRRKVRVYAEANVPQLILIDVPKREARILRGPRNGDYDRVDTIREGTPIPIDAFPDVTFDLTQVLPKATP